MPRPSVRSSGRIGSPIWSDQSLLSKEHGECVAFCQMIRRFYGKVGFWNDGETKTYPGTDMPEVRYRIGLAPL